MIPAEPAKTSVTSMNTGLLRALVLLNTTGTLGSGCSEGRHLETQGAQVVNVTGRCVLHEYAPISRERIFIRGLWRDCLVEGYNGPLQWPP